MTEQFTPPLIPHFDLLATAPGGVARLRELILTLAVQGKLVPQDPTDEPASVLLQRIRAEKDRLIAAGNIKRDKSLAQIDDENPFNIPSHWSWTRFDTLIDPRRPISYGVLVPGPEVQDGIPFVRIADLSINNPREKPEKNISPAVDAQYQRTRLEGGEILMGVVGSIGKLGIAPASWCGANIARAICRIVPASCINKHFVLLLLESEFMQKNFAGDTRTLAQPTLNVGLIRNAPTPLPPLAEQSRIVTRVEELMRLCDALEQQRQLETAQHAQLLNTLLGTLTDCTSPDELAANWQRVSDHFDLLFDRPEAVDALEQTILQLAVRGLLVPQDPADEPASVLLQRIRAEKDRLISAGKIKRDKPLPAITEKDKPFALPTGWTCARFPDLSVITGGATPSKASDEYWTGDIPWVSPKDMKVAVISDAQDHISSLALKGSLSLIPSGSLLMVVRGMILAHSFPVAQTSVPVTINQDMKALTPLEPELLPFLALICEGMKPEILGLVDRSTHGTCKMESPKIFGLAIPLPPLAEQTRIVARVTQLRDLCTTLRQRLAAGQATQRHLAEALVEV